MTICYIFIQLSVKRKEGLGFELAYVTMSTMHALQNNLDAKTKQYKELALLLILLMNTFSMVMNLSAGISFMKYYLRKQI